MRTFTLYLALCVFSVNAYAQTPISMATLRATATPSTTAPYFITDPGREGIFYYDTKDGYTADNGGTVLVVGTKRFKRSFSGPIDIRWFGGVADYNGTSGTDNKAAINAAMSAASINQTVMIPAGAWYVSSTIALPLASVKRVPMEIFGNIYFAKGGGFIVEGNNQRFVSHATISGGYSGATSESEFAAYTGIGVYLKNTVNSYISVNDIYGFKYGIEESGDKAGGTPAGSQYNSIYFTSIHHNYVQIKIAVVNNSSMSGNWANESFWYGGQLGNGTPKVTYGEGGWYGLIIQNDPGAAPTLSIQGQIFYNIGFEGLEKAAVLKNCNGITFFGGGIEPDGVHAGFDFDPATCSNTMIVGYSFLYETQFVAGRLGANTQLSATPFWVGAAAPRNFAGTEAVSTSASRWMITAPKYSFTNFTSYNNNDLNTISGPYPTIQAMTTRINGVTRNVPFKSTFLHVTSATAGSPVALPRNIGCLRVEATEAKVFKVDSGDLVQFGEGFIIEYLTPAFPISFVRADNGTVLVAATSFPSGGTYRMTWAAGQYKIARIGEEFKTFNQVNAAYSVTDGVQTVFVNYIYGPCTTTLPAAAAYPGRTITIKNMQAAKTVTVNGVSASDGNLMQGRGAMTVRSDGASWNVISFYQKAITY